MPRLKQTVVPPSGGAATGRRDAAIGRILDRTLDDMSFIFDHPDELETMSNDKSQIIRAVDKVAVETMLLLDVVVRTDAIDVQDGRIQALLEICSAGIRSARNRFLFTHNPRLCTSFGLGHVLLTGLGHEDPEFDRILAAASASPAMHPANKLPFRLLDDYWVMDRAGLGLPRRRQRLLADFTMLTAPISPLYYRTDDYYALTHEIMYLTDFGGTSLPPEYDIDTISELIDVGILDNLRSYDLDVLAELVAVRAMVRPGKPSPVAAAASALLGQEFDRLGLLPSRNFDPEALAQLTDPVLHRCYLFFNTYHTTHVFAMMLSILDRAGVKAPGARVKPAKLLQGPEANLCQANANAPVWLPRFKCLDLPVEELNGIMTGVALFDAVRRQDALALFAILNVVKGGDIRLPGRLMSDMMQHLARISLCDGT